VSVLLGNGDGSFRAPVSYPVGSSPGSVAVGDFNGDGHLDLVTANGFSGFGNTVSVLLGNGDGTFGPPRTYASGSGTQSVWRWGTSTATASQTSSRPTTLGPAVTA
jgi:hypothetical protein